MTDKTAQIQSGLALMLAGMVLILIGQIILFVLILAGESESIGKLKGTPEPKSMNLQLPTLDN